MESKVKETIYPLLARRIREERKKAGLTLESLAEAADITPGFLLYIEQNKKKPSLATVEKLANAFGISLSDLFSGISPCKNPDCKITRQITHFLRDKSPNQRAMMVRLIRTIFRELSRKNEAPRAKQKTNSNFV